MCTEKRNTTSQRISQSLQGSISWNCASSSTQIYIYLSCKGLQEIDKASQTTKLCCEVISEKGNSTRTAGPGITLTSLSHRQLWLKKENTLGEAWGGRSAMSRTDRVKRRGHAQLQLFLMFWERSTQFPPTTTTPTFQIFQSQCLSSALCCLWRTINHAFWKYWVCIMCGSKQARDVFCTAPHCKTHFHAIVTMYFISFVLLTKNNFIV